VPAIIANKNDFDEYYSCCIGVGLKIKDAYVDKIDKDNSKVTCGIKYTAENKECDYNLLTAEITNVRGAESGSTSQEQETKKYELNTLKRMNKDEALISPENTILNGGLAMMACKDYSRTTDLYVDADYYTFYEISNITLEKVTGTIYIK